MCKYVILQNANTYHLFIIIYRNNAYKISPRFVSWQ